MPGTNVSRSTMTKADIIEKVYQKIGFSKKEASELVEMVFDQLKGVLCKGDKVKISGFGNFIVRGKNLRLETVEKAIKLSAEKYCSASLMLGKTAEITHTCEVIEG